MDAAWPEHATLQLVVHRTVAGRPEVGNRSAEKMTISLTSPSSMPSTVSPKGWKQRGAAAEARPPVPPFVGEDEAPAANSSLTFAGLVGTWPLTPTKVAAWVRRGKATSIDRRALLRIGLTRLHQPDLVGEDDRLHPVARSELVEDVADMGLDRALAQEQGPRDLGVGPPTRDQPQDLPLAVGQGREHSRRLP